ncbi:hypothetical protein HPB47_000698, partial [Ixodes persulcatus]
SSRVHNADVLTLCLSGDEKSVYVAGVDPLVVEFTRIGQSQKWVKSLQRTNHTHDVRALACAKDWIVSGGMDTYLAISSRTSLTKHLSFERSAVQLASASGHLVLNGESHLELWQLGSSGSQEGAPGEALPLSTRPALLAHVRPRQGTRFHCAAVSPNCQWLAGSTADRVLLYRVNLEGDGRAPSFEKVAPLMDELGPARFLLFTEDCSRLLVFSVHGAVQVFQLGMPPTLLHTIPATPDATTHVYMACLCSGKFFATADNESNVVVYSLQSYEVVCRLPQRSSLPTAMRFAPKSCDLVVVFSDNQVIEFDVEQGAYTHWCQQMHSAGSLTLKTRSPLTGLTFDPKNQGVFFLYNDHELFLIDKKKLLFHIWIVLPIASGSIEGAPHSCKSAGVAGGKGDGMAADATDQDPWEWWNRFRSICATDKRLGVALRLTANLPSEEHLLRWYGEPVWCLLVPTTLFLTNKKGYPVLSKSHQAVIRQFFKLNCQVLVEGCCHHKHMRHYCQYIDHLYNTQPPENPLGEFARGYEDQLQIPLQPLMDNLESVTYEIFEKDPVKYTEYQKAIYMALTDRKEEFGSSEIVLMVLGAGRGPLVRAALNAAEAADQKIKIYAIEKNPNAVLTLLSLKEKVWKDKVTVVSCDMREYEPPDKADIVVSELLGSFGDNELAPECLDGAQRFLKDLLCCFLICMASVLVQAAFEMPYVVQLQNIAVPASPQPLFSFVHPNKEEKIDNSRYKSLKFEIKDNYVLHGFAGYFDCVLYKDISLMNLVKGSAVEVRFWRCVAKRKVWYEWLVVQPHLGTVHNPCGRSHTMGL